MRLPPGTTCSSQLMKPPGPPTLVGSAPPRVMAGSFNSRLPPPIPHSSANLRDLPLLRIFSFPSYPLRFPKPNWISNPPHTPSLPPLPHTRTIHSLFSLPSLFSLSVSGPPPPSLFPHHSLLVLLTFTVLLLRFWFSTVLFPPTVLLVSFPFLSLFSLPFLVLDILSPPPTLPLSPPLTSCSPYLRFSLSISGSREVSPPFSSCFPSPSFRYFSPFFFPQPFSSCFLPFPFAFFSPVSCSRYSTPPPPSLFPHHSLLVLLTFAVLSLRSGSRQFFPPTVLFLFSFPFLSLSSLPFLVLDILPPPPSLFPHHSLLVLLTFAVLSLRFWFSTVLFPPPFSSCFPSPFLSLFSLPFLVLDILTPPPPSLFPHHSLLVLLTFAVLSLRFWFSTVLFPPTVLFLFSFPFPFAFLSPVSCSRYSNPPPQPPSFPTTHFLFSLPSLFSLSVSGSRQFFSPHRSLLVFPSLPFAFSLPFLVLDISTPPTLPLSPPLILVLLTFAVLFLRFWFSTVPPPHRSLLVFPSHFLSLFSLPVSCSRYLKPPPLPLSPPFTSCSPYLRCSLSLRFWFSTVFPPTVLFSFFLPLPFAFLSPVSCSRYLKPPPPPSLFPHHSLLVLLTFAVSLSLRFWFSTVFPPHRSLLFSFPFFRFLLSRFLFSIF
ncbi:hypothetical protein C7M84_013946 [Penaeus vannamei]|uniref:Uncharacterized protein n=1 Tax=Penaeus vannamei TaxID=6689 RepID=A0A423SUQ2_PENVA|nr:hypothetical protein C7M84_013946 [Penaeus vannamei]